MSLPPDELGRLYRGHAAALRLFARQWPGEADDAVHDAFVQLARQHIAPAEPLPWLYAVVRNAVRAASRTAERRRKREDAVRTSDAWFASTDDRLDGQEATRHLAALTLEQREVIVARLWGGLTFDEVATLVGCSLPTAHRRYHAGLTELRARLEGRCNPTPT